LGLAPGGVLGVAGLQGCNLLLLQVREQSQALAGVRVGQVDPVLVESVGTGPAGIEPQRARLGLAHLRAVALGQERAGDAVELGAAHAPGEVDARRDVAPLVAPAHLDLAAVLLVQVHEIVGLQEHIAELGVAQPAVGALQAGFDRVLGEHHVDGEVLAHVAQELQEAEAAHPIVVVHHQRCVGLGGEVEEPAKLLLDGTRIGAEHLRREQTPLLALSTRVADHAGGPADQGDGAVAPLLESAQDHQRHQVAHVQAVGRWVEPGVHRARLLHKPAGQGRVVGRLMDHSAPAEFGGEVVHCRQLMVDG